MLTYLFGAVAAILLCVVTNKLINKLNGTSTPNDTKAILLYGLLSWVGFIVLLIIVLTQLFGFLYSRRS